MSTSFLGVKSVKNSVKNQIGIEAVIRGIPQAQVIEEALKLYTATRHGLTAEPSEELRRELAGLMG